MQKNETKNFLKAEIATKQTEIDNKLAEIQDAINTRDALDNTADNYQGNLDNWNRFIDELTFERDAFQGELDILNTKLTSLNTELNTANTEEANLLQTRDDTLDAWNVRKNEKLALVNEYFDLTKDTQAEGMFSSAVSSMIGNIDEKQIYTIRCDQVNSSYFYDSRPSGDYVKKPIIYMGALKFNNSNPKETFCYHVNPDIMNSDFTLYIDDNHRPFQNPILENPNENGVGIRPSLNVGITFILYDY